VIWTLDNAARRGIGVEALYLASKLSWNRGLSPSPWRATDKADDLDGWVTIGERQRPTFVRKPKLQLGGRRPEPRSQTCCARTWTAFADRQGAGDAAESDHGAGVLFEYPLYARAKDPINNTRPRAIAKLRSHLERRGVSLRFLRHELLGRPPGGTLGTGLRAFPRATCGEVFRRIGLPTEAGPRATVGLQKKGDRRGTVDRADRLVGRQPRRTGTIGAGARFSTSPIPG